MADHLHNLRKRRRQRLTVEHRPSGDQRVAVIGLGRLGSSLANELMRRGWEALGIDTDARLVQKYSDGLTHAVVADSTEPARRHHRREGDILVVTGKTRAVETFADLP
ncbi:NAD-binding protein [Streptomyces sp. ISL-36]|uniref:NAD-binding protein n=1 Tax=Streptomyces sp. ISL-36 TaxID=2819182 RepID=UPI001BEC1DEE|nr:NAD-binding protein [Streptomyces sp. ISL-36]MBT2439701.1 NAD-binding protein [Streptomyces sp. ISL-36]